MRMLAPTGAVLGIAAGLIAAAPPVAWSQEAPPQEATPAAPAGPVTGAPAPEDLARDKALAHDRLQAEARNQASAKPKITGGTVAEAGGGVAGGFLAQGIGTAVAGPVGGFAAGWIGSNLGGKAVHVVRKVFGKKEPAVAAQPPSADASATAPEPVRDPGTPGPN